MLLSVTGQKGMRKGSEREEFGPGQTEEGLVSPGESLELIYRAEGSHWRVLNRGMR